MIVREQQTTELFSMALEYYDRAPSSILLDYYQRPVGTGLAGREDPVSQRVADVVIGGQPAIPSLGANLPLNSPPGDRTRFFVALRFNP